MARDYFLQASGQPGGPGVARKQFAIQPSLEWAAARAARLGVQRPGLPAAPAAGEPRREALGAGLSKLHNVTIDTKSDLRPGERSATLSIAVGGSLVTVRTPPRLEFVKPPMAPAKREAITEWSCKSRMALKCALAKLRSDAVSEATFITLTYPSEFPAPDDHAVYKNHLRVFNQSFARAFDACGFWKLEFQTRGAAHFHLIVFGLEGQDIEAMREWVAQRWFGIVGSGDAKPPPCRNPGRQSEVDQWGNVVPYKVHL